MTRSILNDSAKTKAWALSSASALVLGIAAVPMLPVSAYAQDDPEEIDLEAPGGEEDDDSSSDDTIIVTGVRQSLESAQDIKRNADTIVDSITATDIGSFPDKSVAEALQRVAGITVNRFAASSDTAHFSAEPSGVVVRGLNFVRSEFNGRDTFSANSSRGLSWTDISPELLAGADTYKNQTAELIEGGIAGTINLRTRVPFDQDGRLVALSGNVNYNDLAGTVTPEVSGLISDRWMTDIGEFGLLGNLAYSDVNTRSEGIQLYRMFRADGLYAPAGQVTFLPERHIVRDNLYDRQRTGMAVAGQWESLDSKWLATVQFNRSEYDNAWEEYVIEAAYGADLTYQEPLDVTFTTPDLLDSDNERSVVGNGNIPQPLLGTNFTFDDRGFLQTGTIVGDNTAWTGNPSDAAADWTGYFAMLDSGEPLFTQCYNWQGCYGQYSAEVLAGDQTAGELSQRGSRLGTRTRSNNREQMTQDLGINLKYAPTDRLRFNFDAQWVDATVENYDIEIAFETFAQQMVDYTGDVPILTLQTPPNMGVTDGYLARPDSYRYQYVMDHIEDSEGNEYALRGDAEYDFVDSGLLTSLKVGARWSKREQTIRNSAYNWQGSGAVTWQARGHIYNINRFGPPADYSNYTSDTGTPVSFNGYPMDIEGRLWDDDFYGGGKFNGANVFYFYDMEAAQDREYLASTLGAEALGFDIAGYGWDPICSNRGDRADEVTGTCYTPEEVSDISEETAALYAQLNFGGRDAELFGLPYSGNIGVRYVNTIDTSTGGLDYPRLGDEYFVDTDGSGAIESDERTVGNVLCEVNDPEPIIGDDGEPTGEFRQPEVPQSTGCYLSDEDIRFTLGGSALTETENEFDNWLPSFNIKFDLTDDWILRFAASRAMSRPDIGDLRNYLSVGASLPDQGNAGDPQWITDGDGTITGAEVRYSGSGRNPFLRPVIANQFDLSLEYYFSNVGSFTAAVFYKEFEDYIQYSRYFRPVTIDGVTRDVQVRGPINGEGASIQGFEVAYQNFFDFLPAPWDGLGVQANYTYVDNQGISNAGPVGEDGGESTQQFAGSTIQVDALEGLSEHGYNLVGMYEKDKFAARLAYNWRSEYLVTVIDCCVAYPVWNEDQGFLDGSIRYSLNENVQMSLQVQNILDTETVTTQQVTDQDDGGLRLPTGYFKNDRRYTLGLRFKF